MNASEMQHLRWSCIYQFRIWISDGTICLKKKTKLCWCWYKSSHGYQWCKAFCSCNLCCFELHKNLVTINKIQWNYHLQAVCCSKFMTLASLLAGAPWAVKNKYKVFKLINFMFVHEKLNSKWMKLESEEEFLFLTTTKCKLRIRMNYLQ